MITDLTRYKTLPLDKLCPASWNYKIEDEHLTEKLKNNLKRSGQVENLIVRELDTGFYEIVNGNHRYHALLAIGATDAVCYDCGLISLGAAQRLAIETNETGFDRDEMKLATLLNTLKMEFTIDDMGLSMPWDAAEIESMAHLGEFNFDGHEDAYQEKLAANKAAGEADPAGEGYKTVNFVVPETVYDAWIQLVEEARETLQYDKTSFPNVESYIFELALAEMRAALPNV